MSSIKFIGTLILFLVALSTIKSETQTITATIYADNYFEFYLNGNLVKVDPLDFTPHNAVKFSFQVTKGDKRVYAIKASDFATESGYEYTLNNPQIGDGGLRIAMTDGTVSSTEWKCFVTSYGPTDESNAAGCSATNLSVCKLRTAAEPDGWKLLNFDDSKWVNANVYTDADVGWGMTPKYANGMCGTLTSPYDRQNKNPNSISTVADDCLDPKVQSWGTSKFMWTSDLKRDNTILCRLTTSSTSNIVLTGGSNDGFMNKLSMLVVFLTFLFIF
jgi:hypothetical protein